MHTNYYVQFTTTRDSVPLTERHSRNHEPLLIGRAETLGQADPVTNTAFDAAPAPRRCRGRRRGRRGSLSRRGAARRRRCCHRSSGNEKRALIRFAAPRITGRTEMATYDEMGRFMAKCRAINWWTLPGVPNRRERGTHTLHRPSPTVAVMHCLEWCSMVLGSADCRVEWLVPGGAEWCHVVPVVLMMMLGLWCDEEVPSRWV